ncbi:31-O-demethyl-FK506 methyltransferase FkbM [Gemmata obscuriglobus]|nr:31-O-demethyl-FK506 methyltransferase FkbM [Gemmata obscuriglobus]VTS04103.1 Uncharacterized protein OS=Blastopirellula marina DSM 3645 GN=DSM3645_28307 PE=4 SV=1: Methyltransf_21 [Gemmata obscuriglobus UQM 2246]
MVRLPWGCALEIDIREDIGRSVWTAGVFDLAVAEVLFRAADPALLALDVGANIGSMSGLLAARAAEVWAFEPYPPVLERLRRNVSRLTGAGQFAHCQVFPLALSDHEGEARLACPDGSDKNHGLARIADSGSVAVRVAPLDALLGNREVGVMKLDVEGHEQAVLSGATHSLAAGRIRNIVFEDHVGPGGAVGKILRSYGYKLYAIGWVLRGPVLKPADETAHRVYEAPSYLATLAPEVVASCRQRGWRCLGRG